MSDQEVEPKTHPARTRRQRIQELDRMFSHVVVRQGTQQATAIETVRDRARVLAVTIEERCPEGRGKTMAINKVLEAMEWAHHAISHR